MATIALYANQINQMPSLLKEVKQSVSNYKSELTALRNKTLTINKSICDLEDVISSIQSSTQTQEDKIASLDAFYQNSETFIADVVSIDKGVADLINQRKNDFYSTYSYLKPDCEKNLLEKIYDGAISVVQWCKEHWKLFVTIIIVIVAIALLLTGVGGILAAMAIGALFGAAIGGLVGGIISVISGGSFLEGFENGAFMGVIAGVIAGGMAFVMTAGLVSALIIGAVSGSASSLLSDLGDIFIKGVDISIGQVFLNMFIAGALGAAFAGVGYGFSRGLSALGRQIFSGKPVNTNGGKVTFKVPPKSTPKQVRSARAYVSGSNKALRAGALSPNGRVSTTGTLQSQASRAASLERARAAAAGKPYKGVVGHVPDTTWTGNPQAFMWLDQDAAINSSFGGQARGYPIGYKPTGFSLQVPGYGIPSSSVWSAPFGPIFGGCITR